MIAQRSNPDNGYLDRQNIQSPVLYSIDDLPRGIFLWCYNLAMKATTMDSRAKRREMKEQGMQYLIINDSGFCSFKIDLLDDESTETVLYLYELHVVDLLRSNGIGGRLLEALKTYRGNKRIVLTVHKKNQKAIDFYTRRGFAMDSTCPCNYGHDVDYLIYSL